MSSPNSGDNTTQSCWSGTWQNQQLNITWSAFDLQLVSDWSAGGERSAYLFSFFFQGMSWNKKISTVFFVRTISVNPVLPGCDRNCWLAVCRCFILIGLYFSTACRVSRISTWFAKLAHFDCYLSIKKLKQNKGGSHWRSAQQGGRAQQDRANKEATRSDGPGATWGSSSLGSLALFVRAHGQVARRVLAGLFANKSVHLR